MIELFSISMYTVKAELVRVEIKKRGFKSLSDFAKNVGLHRNMLSYYLSGKPVIPEGLGRIIDSLELSLEQVIEKQVEERRYGLRDIAGLVDELYEKYPENIFLLFGSRARETNAKYSDFDIGTYSDGKFSGDDFLTMLTIKSDFEDRVPFFVDLVNLNLADDEFLKNVSQDWQLLAGDLSTWVNLNEKVR